MTTSTVSSEERRASEYDKDFEQHMVDHNVYTDNLKSTPKSGTDLRPLSGERTRRSLSPSLFSDDAFEAFKRVHKEVKSDEDVIREIIPVICGDANIANSGEVLFDNLYSITNWTTADPKPDFYDGAYPEDIDPAVENTLDGLIIPCISDDGLHPVAPNLFLEAKGPQEDADVAKRQACLAGAYGARAMHALQNYGKEEPQYDGKAYAYSSTYHAGTLKLYAHHVTAPTTEGGRPEYHMTHMSTYVMTDSREEFVRGATAFRNARDLAKRRRDDLIQGANRIALEENMAAAYEGFDFDTATEIQYWEYSSDELALSSQRDLHEDDDLEDPLGQASMAPDMNDQPMSFMRSFTPSFTSSVSSHRARSKRQLSPGSSVPEQGPSKSRTRRTTRATPASPASPASTASYGSGAGGCSRVQVQSGGDGLAEGEALFQGSAGTESQD